MTKTEQKELARKAILYSIHSSMYSIDESTEYDHLTDEERNELAEVCSKEWERIEKLFGYKANSWGRW